MAGSISGLVSGLNTADIIDQLMQLEAAPQKRLETQQGTQKSVLTALQALNTDTSLLVGKAEALAKASTWQTFQGTSTSNAVAVSVSAGATAASFAVTVDRVAVPHQLGFGQPAALDDVVASPPVVRITSHDGTVHDIATGGGSLEEIVAAVNSSSSETGVRATAVRVADGEYQLMVQATQTGVAGRFTLTLEDGSALLGGATVQQGEDAQISLGLGITAASPTNTFADLLPGVTITLGGGATAGTTSTVAITRDTTSVKSAVKALVEQVNGLLTTIDGKVKMAFAGEAAARSLRDALSDTVFPGGTVSMSTYGIQTDRYGKLVFDESKFDASYAADPAATAAMFTSAGDAAEDGWAARVVKVAKAASDSTDGYVTSAIQGRTATIDRLQDSIDAWDLRLELRRTTLTRQYTALETALSGLKSQGDWLAGQIATLSSSSNS